MFDDIIMISELVKTVFRKNIRGRVEPAVLFNARTIYLQLYIHACCRIRIFLLNALRPPNILYQL